LAVGGHKLEEDLDNLKNEGCNLVVGTVGRVWDLIQRGTISLKKIKVFIIDEADLIIEQGNQVKVSEIMQALPKQRRTGLFSATMTHALNSLVKIGMRNPYFVEIFSYKDEELKKKYEPYAISSLREEYATVKSFEAKEK